MRLRYPQSPLVLTTATPTGRARALSLFGADADVRFLPYDTPRAMALFLDNIDPQLAVIMETELWPNLFNECRKRRLPVILASARLSAKSVARYQRFGALFREVFSSYVVIAAQTAEDAERFRAIGAAASRTHVIGNIKFDLELPPDMIEQGRALRALFGQRRAVWIAGSTHAGEEETVLDAHAALCKELPDALLLLAPRHPARFQHAAVLLTRRGFEFGRRSVGASAGTVMLVDTVGELAMLYAAADVAFVGGSLVPVGGHNLLEPAALAVPVLTGPYFSNAKDIGRLLLKRGAAIQVNDAFDIARELQRLFADPEERQRIGSIGAAIVAANRGSVARLLVLIESLLSGPSAEAPANRSTGR
jgi:3-deoxy-D-manno-octulosonic-acid transferase